MDEISISDLPIATVTTIKPAIISLFVKHIESTDNFFFMILLI